MGKTGYTHWFKVTNGKLGIKKGVNWVFTFILMSL